MPLKTSTLSISYLLFMLSLVLFLCYRQTAKHMQKWILMVQSITFREIYVKWRKEKCILLQSTWFILRKFVISLIGFNDKPRIFWIKRICNQPFQKGKMKTGKLLNVLSFKLLLMSFLFSISTIFLHLLFKLVNLKRVCDI